MRHGQLAAGVPDAIVSHTKGHADVVGKIQRYKIRKLKRRTTFKKTSQNSLPTPVPVPPLTSTPRFSFPPPPAPLGLAPFPIKVSWASSPALAPLLSLLAPAAPQLRVSLSRPLRELPAPLKALKAGYCTSSKSSRNPCLHTAEAPFASQSSASIFSCTTGAAYRRYSCWCFLLKVVEA